MRISVLMVAGAVTLAHGAQAQGPWGNVKSWTGSVTIEATDTRKGEGTLSTMNYKATGNFIIADDMMPDGSHMMWPMPGEAAMSDPKKLAASQEAWQSHVVAGYEAKGVGESGGAFTVTCSADNKQGSQIGVVINPTEPTYVLSVSAPAADFKCTGATGGPGPTRLQQSTFKLTGARGAPGKVSGTQTFTSGTETIKVSYEMSPSK